MNIGYRDLQILEILTKGSLTAYGLAKLLFPDTSKKKIQNYSDKSQTIKSRLKKLERYNLIEKIPNTNKNYYKAIDKNVIFLENLEIPIKKKETISLHIVFLIRNKDKWNVYQF